MPSMRDIKRRIRSIQSTQQITKAMKMVAAAKLRRTQGKVAASRPYAEKLEDVLRRLVEVTSDYRHPLLERREPRRVGYVLFTGDRGLCGGYNINIARRVEQEIRSQSLDSAVVAVGRKGRDYLRRRGFDIREDYVDVGDNPEFSQARELAGRLTGLYQDGTFDVIYLGYTRFYSAIRQQPVVQQLLPLLPPAEAAAGESDYIYEPSAGEVLDTLLPRYLEVEVYQSFLEAKASEHGARMTAMDSATKNAGEIIDKLVLYFNRARQAAITKEITEVVGGAEALN